MMASPRWMGIALPTLLGLGSPVLLSSAYVQRGEAIIAPSTSSGGA